MTAQQGLDPFRLATIAASLEEFGYDRAQHDDAFFIDQAVNRKRFVILGPI